MVTIFLKNNKSKIDCSAKLMIRLRKQDSMRVRVKGAFYAPSFKNGSWDGFIKFITDAGYIATGKVPHLLETLNALDKKYKIVDQREFPIRPEKLSKTLNNKFKLRDYQGESLMSLFNNKLGKLPFPRGIIFGATNFGKCCKYDTYLSIKGKGLLKIEDLAVPNMVINKEVDMKLSIETGDGYKKTNHYLKSGIIKTIKIITNKGYVLTSGYENHRVKIVKPNGLLSWEKVSNLKTSNTIPIYYNQQCFGQPKKIMGVSLDGDLAYVLGALHGDGYITKKRFAISSHKDDIYILETIKRVLKNKLNIDTNIEEPRKGRRVNLNRIQKSSKTLEELFNIVPELKNNSHSKRVPRVILESPKEVQTAYLQGYFDTDGTSGVGRKVEEVSITSVSKNSMYDVQQMLLNLGIVSRLDIKKTSWTHRGIKKIGTAYRLRISGSFLETFYYEVGFRLARKEQRLKNFIGISNKPINIIPKEANNLLRVLRDKTKRKSKIPISRYMRRGTNISKEVLKLYLGDVSDLKDLKEYRILETYLNPNIFWDFIKKLSLGEDLCYDIEVPDGNTYIGNGFINHNTITSAGIYTVYNKPTLYLVNSKELFNQAVEEMADFIPKEDIGVVCADRPISWKPFTIVMIPTAYSRIHAVKNMLAKYPIVIVDECDLGTSKSYKTVLNYTYNAYVRVGLSGSVIVDKRKKEKNQQIIAQYGPIIHEVRNRELMDKGHSAEVMVHIHEGNTLINIPKDYLGEENLGIIQSNERNGKVLRRVMFHKRAKRLPILVVVKFHNHVRKLMAMIDAYPERFEGLVVDWVHHKRPDRKEVVQRYKEGKIDILIGTYILKRGKNFPLMQALINAGGGDSFENVIQILGRATRTDQSKDYTWLDDFWDEGYYLKKHSKHRLIAYKNEKLQIEEHYKK